MLGSDKAFAHPTLVISHNDEVILKRTMRVVRRPKTLKWKGFKLKGRQVLQYPAPIRRPAVLSSYAVSNDLRSLQDLLQATSNPERLIRLKDNQGNNALALACMEGDGHLCGP